MVVTVSITTSIMEVIGASYLEIIGLTMILSVILQRKEELHTEWWLEK